MSSAKNPFANARSTARRLSSSCATPAAISWPMMGETLRRRSSTIWATGRSGDCSLPPYPVPRGAFAMLPPRRLRGQLSSVLSLLYPRLPGRYQDMGISDGEEHRALLEECRHGARGGAIAGARDGWLKRERGLSSALPLPAYTRWMGQRCHRLAPGGAADPVEAFRRDSPNQEMTGVPAACHRSAASAVPPATPAMNQCAARRFANAPAPIQRSNWLARRPH